MQVSWQGDASFREGPGGSFSSTYNADTKFRDALRDWKVRRTTPMLGADELRRLWREGSASGPGRFKTIGDIKKEARRRTASAKKARP